MKPAWKHFVACLLCLATLLPTSGTPLTSYAATRTSQQPRNSCAPTDPINTGVSYDASLYDPILTDAPAQEYMAIYSYDFPPHYLQHAIGAWTCGSNTIVLGLRVYPSGGWYNLETTVNGMTTITTPPFTEVSPAENVELDVETTLNVQADQQYTFRVQYCWIGDLGLSTCVWTPHLQIATAANSSCQNGYVWRQAAIFDHVCVQPWEAAQAAYDNSQTAARGNDTPWTPLACNPGYVWREAWGGDYTCVDPPQRQQVYDDNSNAINHIVQL